MLLGSGSGDQPCILTAWQHVLPYTLSGRMTWACIENSQLPDVEREVVQVTPGEWCKKSGRGAVSFQCLMQQSLAARLGILMPIQAHLLLLCALPYILKSVFELAQTEVSRDLPLRDYSIQGHHFTAHTQASSSSRTCLECSLASSETFGFLSVAL
jgi:hypothetical protein